MEQKLVITEDGSHTISVPELNEHYHSTHGAMQESKHVFIENGLKQFKKLDNPFSILEIGFGTGLNALYTYLETQPGNERIYYITIEPYPVEKEMIRQLNYPELLKRDDAGKVFKQMHETTWYVPFYISDNFLLNKLNEKLEDVQLKEEQFQLVYFDAFSPHAQSEMWEQQVFDKLYHGIRKNGILVTYSAKGVVKRALKEAGFIIENPPGPAGKREMTRAIKK